MNTSPRVCISAGHGLASRNPRASDPGATANGIQEDDVVLALSRDVVADLRAMSHRGMWAMLRNAGAYYSADDDAVKAGCDIFIELHLNSGTAKATGTETLVNTAASATSKRLAHALQSRVVAALRLPDRGVKSRGDLAVLKVHKDMASALVEVFFVTNAGDVAAYRARRDAVELAIVNGILATLGWREVKYLPRKWGPLRKARYRPTI